MTVCGTRGSHKTVQQQPMRLVPDLNNRTIPCSHPFSNCLRLTGGLKRRTGSKVDRRSMWWAPASEFPMTKARPGPASRPLCLGLLYPIEPPPPPSLPQLPTGNRGKQLFWR